MPYSSCAHFAMTGCNVFFLTLWVGMSGVDSVAAAGGVEALHLHSLCSVGPVGCQMGHEDMTGQFCPKGTPVQVFLAAILSAAP